MSGDDLLQMIAQEALEAIRRDIGGNHEEENIPAAGGR